MLGFAAGGTVLVVRGPRDPSAGEAWVTGAALLTSVLLLVVPLGSRLLTVDAAQLPWDPWQWARLAALDCLLALPFISGSIAVLSGIEMARDRPGSVYGASFIGSASGAAAALLLLTLFPPDRAILAPAALAALGAVAPPGRRQARIASVPLAAVTVVLVFGPTPGSSMSPYKDLVQARALPGAATVAERFGPSGVVTAVAAPAFRYAPGLSLAFTGPIPSQTGVFVDGDLAGAYSTREIGSHTTDLLDWLPEAGVYRVANGRVLIAGGGGRAGVETALSHKADAVVVVEGSSELVELLRRADDARFGVTWSVGGIRTLLARRVQAFDVVAIGSTGGPGSNAAGLHALDEDFRHTVDAYAVFLAALRSGGVLSVTQWRTTPERGILRIVLTVVAALEARDIPAADNAVVIVRSWGSATVLVKPDGFTSGDRAALRVWSASRGFDVLEISAEQPDRWIHGDSTRALEHLLETLAIGGPGAEPFVASYPFAIRPVGDTRPYPHHHLSGRVVIGAMRAGAGQWLPVAEWGYLTALVTLVVSMVLGSVLLLGPAALPRRVRRRPPFVTIGYFAMIGLAYMLAEIALIQILGLLLGHPTLAVTVSLGALLVGSGLGSMVSDRYVPTPTRPVLMVALALAAAAVGILSFVQGALGTSAGVRWMTGIGTATVLGFAMGWPFPIGLRSLATARDRLAWAWAGNGVASVIAAPLAVLIAIDWGARALFGGAASAYLVAWMFIRRVPADSPTLVPQETRPPSEP
jgi:hypothetical protein